MILYSFNVRGKSFVVTGDGVLWEVNTYGQDTPDSWLWTFVVQL
jgi:hypothetical protein